MTNSLLQSPDYLGLLEDLEQRIRAAQVRASLSINREVVLLYWSIGRDILARQAAQGWGAKVVAQLSRDLRRAFPESRGYSVRNLNYMRTFAEAWPDGEFVQQVAAQIPWFHNCRVIAHTADRAEREFYLRAVLEHGWSRDILALQMDGDLYHRQGQALTNFSRTLPPPQSDLAQQTLKDPYHFDFLTVGPEASEREVEHDLVSQVQALLLELGVGFAFVGRQYHIEVAGRDYYIDLLFYHYRLHAFVVVELKVGEFEPEHAGKLDFYLSAVDDLLRQPDDRPTIGLLLCRRRDRVTVEYTLRRSTSPLGVAVWKNTRALPARLSASLPAVEDLEAELASLTDPEAGSAEE